MLTIPYRGLTKSRRYATIFKEEKGKVNK